MNTFSDIVYRNVAWGRDGIHADVIRRRIGGDTPIAAVISECQLLTLRGRIHEIAPNVYSVNPDA